jgi:hypothetical protein
MGAVHGRHPRGFQKTPTVLTERYKPGVVEIAISQDHLLGCSAVNRNCTAVSNIKPTHPEVKPAKDGNTISPSKRNAKEHSVCSRPKILKNNIGCSRSPSQKPIGQGLGFQEECASFKVTIAS